MTGILLSESIPARVCFLLAGAVFAGFFLIFLLSGLFTTFNSGNLAGCIMSGMGIFFCFFRRTAAALIITIGETTAGRIFLAVSGVFAVICLILAAVISVFMIWAADRPVSEPAYVIVLGCRVKEKGPSLMLQKRIDAAYRYLSDHPDALCIASGGQGADEPCSEADAIITALSGMGISSDRLIAEDKSVNTYENIRNSSRIADERGLPRRAVIVTSEFHQLRAYLICRRFSLENGSVSSKTYLPLLPAYWVREWFGAAHEFVFGRK